MTIRRSILLATAIMLALLLGACASLQMRDPPRVTVAGIAPLKGEGFELRLLVKLRVQNPNDVAIEYDGVALDMDVQGQAFASGVSDAAGTVPRFGESVIEVPVTVSAFRMARQAMGMVTGKGREKIDYELKGKLHGPVLRSVRFTTQGSFDLPAASSATPGSG